MRKRMILMIAAVLFVAEAGVLAFFAMWDPGFTQDAVAVNEIVHEAEAALAALGTEGAALGRTPETPGYVVLDGDGRVLLRTREGLSESIHDAIVHRDTMLVLPDGAGEKRTLIIDNDSMERWQRCKKSTAAILSSVILLQCLAGVWYVVYLERVVIRPFQKLKRFAERVAGGNLEIPLAMDRHNLFGAFTESFDLMRSELKRARLAEAKANESKKELVAKLSHDIRTPVASIQAAAEVGAALAADAKTKENYTQILHKTEQINVLVTNLFTAALEELMQLPVSAVDLESARLTELLENADYLHRATLPKVPACLLSADVQRLQQVFDNLFANAYKYADGGIDVGISKDDPYLVTVIEDYGGGVKEEELPHLTEKFRRGSNADGLEGAGLGLHIADSFMREMGGRLVMENGEHGLIARVCIPLGGGNSEI